MHANVAIFMNETAVGEKFLFALAKAVGPVCGVDRVSSSVVTSIDGLKLEYIPCTPQAGVDSIERSAWWLARDTRVGGVRYKSRSGSHGSSRSLLSQPTSFPGEQ